MNNTLPRYVTDPLNPRTTEKEHEQSCFTNTKYSVRNGYLLCSLFLCKTDWNFHKMSSAIIKQQLVQLKLIYLLKICILTLLYRIFICPASSAKRGTMEEAWCSMVMKTAKLYVSVWVDAYTFRPKTVPQLHFRRYYSSSFSKRNLWERKKEKGAEREGCGQKKRKRDR